MYKLLIADDEPLVQAGIKSMIDWEKLNISIAAIASNGSIAYEKILENEPDIVITDIKMPVMTGLELAGKCYQEKRSLPVFIILSSYEEFQYAKEAMKYDVSDYLIKLELTPEILENALKKAIEKVQSLKKSLPASPETSASGLSFLKEQYFMRLILHLFESDEQLYQEAANLNLDFSSQGFLVSYLEIHSGRLHLMNPDQQLLLYRSCLQMIQELISRYLNCYVLSLDTRHFCIIFFVRNPQNAQEEIRSALTQVSSMLYNYYSVSLFAAVGNLVTDASSISSSYHDARQIFSLVNKEQKLLFFSDVSNGQMLKNVFHFSLFRKPLQKAFSEQNSEELHHLFQSIIELFESHQAHYIQAMDAAANILFLSHSLLSNGEQTLMQIFEDRPNGYRSLYSLGSTGQILEWLGQLEQGLCQIFDLSSKDSRHHLVIQVKKYIQEHLYEKLTLNGVAEQFNISPNYLSTLFSRYSDAGFSDFINQQKTELAKQLIAEGEMKIYEISDLLGFESAFYFSRVFKKMTGISPRDYQNRQSETQS